MIRFYIFTVVSYYLVSHPLSVFYDRLPTPSREATPEVGPGVWGHSPQLIAYHSGASSIIYEYSFGQYSSIQVDLNLSDLEWILKHIGPKNMSYIYQDIESLFLNIEQFHKIRDVWDFK